MNAIRSDVRDDAWALVALYLPLMTAEAPQRVHRLREAFHSLRWLVRAGALWRMMPHVLPPWAAVDQQTPRWRQAGVFEAVVHAWRVRLRLAEGCNAQPSAAIFEGRTLPSRPERGTCAGDEGGHTPAGVPGHLAVETLGHLLALPITAAKAQDRAQGEQLARQVPAVTGDAVAVALVDRGDTGDQPAQAAAVQGPLLDVVKRPKAKQGLVLVPRRWGVERRFAWTARVRRLARDDERRPNTLAGFPCLACVRLLLKRVVDLLTSRA